jgi:hypothetical protein
LIVQVIAGCDGKSGYSLAARRGLLWKALELSYWNGRIFMTTSYDRTAGGIKREAELAAIFDVEPR